MLRQITFYKYEVGIQAMKQADDGRYDLVKQPIVELEASSMTKSEMRAAIIEAGYACPRGTDVYADKISRVRYKFTTEALLSIAQEREELELNEKREELELND